MSVSEPLPHDAAWLHVTGQARYVDDIPAPAGCLHLAFGLSDQAHGEILSTDLAAARAAPGVVAALAAQDLAPNPDVSPSAHDEPLLADGTVHYMGQPIFLVVATSHLAARRAARLGHVEIHPLPPVLDVDAALAAGDRHFDGGPRVWSSGDAGRALAASPRTVEGAIEIGGQEHFYLEGQAALALPQEGGDMVVHASSQHPTEIQHKVADALGLPMGAVRVEVRRMGGAFGGKESQGNALAVACAVAARLTERPCKMRYDRDDDMVDHRQAPRPAHDRYRAGFDDGQAASAPSSSSTSCAAAGRSTSRSPSPTARCCTRWAPTTCRTSASSRIRLQDQHPVRHRLPRLRRPAGDARHRARHGPRGPRARP